VDLAYCTKWTLHRVVYERESERARERVVGNCSTLGGCSVLLVWIWDTMWASGAESPASLSAAVSLHDMHCCMCCPVLLQFRGKLGPRCCPSNGWQLVCLRPGRRRAEYQVTATVTSESCKKKSHAKKICQPPVEARAEDAGVKPT
jgi:hypothetical protein